MLALCGLSNVTGAATSASEDAESRFMPFEKAEFEFY